MRRSLATRILLTIGLIVSVAIFIVILNAYDDSRDTAIRGVHELESVVVRSVGRELKIMLETSRNYMALFAERSVLPASITGLLRNDKATFPGFETIQSKLAYSTYIFPLVKQLALLSPDGTILAASTPAMLHNEPLQQLLRRMSRVEYNRSNHEFFRSGQQSRTIVMVESVIEQGRIIGFIAGLLDLDYLARNVVIPESLDGKGYLMVFDPQGELLISPQDLPDTAVMERLSSGEPGFFTYDGKDDTLFVTSSVLENSWSVVAVMGERVALAELRQLQAKMLFFASTIAVGILFLIYLYLKSIVAVLRQAVDFAEHVACNELEQRLCIPSDDELGALASALNRMTKSLKASFSLAENRAQKAEKAEFKSRQATRELKAIVDSIDGGVARFVAGPAPRVLWANEGFYSLSGHPREEHSGRLFLYIHPDDQEMILAALHKNAHAHRAFSVEYRLRHKDDRIVWVYMRALPVDEEQGEVVFQGVFIDMTRQKTTLSELERERERYSIVTELTDDVIFEHDFATDTITFSKECRNLFLQRPQCIDQYSGSIFDSCFIHPDDLGMLKALTMQSRTQAGVWHGTVRLLVNQTDYHWYSLSFRTVGDDKGRPVRCIGRVGDIHAQKMEELRLLTEAQTDLLTGLYNKMTTTRLVKERLAITGQHAMIFVDIDDFKNQNDTHGHAYGDEVICAVASTLRRTFRNSDIIGRMGGDEFMVFVVNYTSLNVICERCRKLSPLVMSDGQLISLSMGMSLFPQHGTTYDELFAHADAALYDVKESGKGRFALFSDEDTLHDEKGENA